MKKVLSIILVSSLALTGLILITNVGNAAAADVTIPNLGLPNYNREAPKTMVETIFNWFFIIAGALCVAIIIWAGITYATAGGDEEKVTKAKTRLIYGIIGVAVIIAAFAITQFIYQAIRGNAPTVPEL